ncbi:MAG: hypothetical protein ACFFCI_11510, partial [Promethearchaeota archaeon]
TIALIKRVKEINPDCEFSIKILFPYPKTLIYDKALELGFKPPNNLYDWSKIRRERAPRYLKHKNYLEMISVTSAVVGKKVFQQEQIPFLKLIRSPATFRWKNEFFRFGFESFFFKIFRDLIFKRISRKNTMKYDSFSHKFISKREQIEF